MQNSWCQSFFWLNIINFDKPYNNIYQISTVMNQYQNSNIYNSPIHNNVVNSCSTAPRSQQTLLKKGYQSVTHYMHNTLPHCVNHKRRKALSYTSLPQGDFLYFCDRCRDLVIKQGFRCKSIEEFNGIEQNNTTSQRQTKQRKNRLEQFLQTIKSLNDRTNRCHNNFQSKINQQLSNNSKEVCLLFQRLEGQIGILKQAYQQQMNKVASNALKVYSQVKFTLTWTQEQLQYLINKIIKNTNRLIRDQGYFALNAKQLQQSLSEKQKKIRTAQTTYNKHAQQFKSINNSITLELIHKIQYIQSVINHTKTISNIYPHYYDDVDEGTTCREIIEEMTTDHFQNQWTQ